MAVSKINPLSPGRTKVAAPRGSGLPPEVMRRGGLSPPRDSTRTAPIPELAQLFQKKLFCFESWWVER